MSAIRKIIGILLLCAAIVGLVFSIAGMVIAWRIAPQITTNLQSSVSLLSDTLQTTVQGLTITQGALKGSVETIKALESTVRTTATTVQSTGPIVVEISRLMEEDLPNTIEATENSLITAQSSAAVIDSVLSTLGSIPLIGAGIGYNPEVPLSDALGDVAASIADLPSSFANIQESLNTTSSNLETFEADLTMMAEAISEIETSVANYDQVIQQYQGSLDQIQKNLETLKGNLPVYVRMLMLALTVFLAWMAIAQLGLLTQGWELLTEGRSREPEQPEETVVEKTEEKPAEEPAGEPKD